MARPANGAVPRRPHHISSIAHLFLEEGVPGLAQEPGRDFLRCAIAAPGGAAISAFAAAGLALGSPGAAILSEDERIRWSAATYFRRAGDPGRIRQEDADDRSNTWAVSAGGGEPWSRSPGIKWSHLGCLGPSELRHLESMAAARSAEPLRRSCADGLVWCLQEDEAVGFGPHYLMGRLAEVIRPRRIEILLFPNAWSSAGRPGWLDEIRAAGSLRLGAETLDAILALGRTACDGIPLQTHQVAGKDILAPGSGDAGGSGSVWRRVAGSLAAEPAEC
jgi:hypothetical protein